MMTTTEIDEALQLLRTLKTSQVRKQLETDNKTRKNNVLRYWDDKSVEWVPRSQIVMDFLKAAKEQL